VATMCDMPYIAREGMPVCSGQLESLLRRLIIDLPLLPGQHDGKARSRSTVSNAPSQALPVGGYLKSPFPNRPVNCLV
jgi:hypothetical protein